MGGLILIVEHLHFGLDLNTLNQIKKNLLVILISDEGGYPKLVTPGLPVAPKSDIIVPGDWVAIRGTNSYNGIQRVKEVIGDSIV